MNTSSSKKHTKGPSVPVIITDCLDNLEQRNALVSEGIFRVSGSNKDIKKLLKIYSRGGRVDLMQVNLNTVAALLKNYLNDIKTNPLIPYDLVDAILQSAGVKNKIHTDRLGHIKQLFNELPFSNKEILYRLLPFLSRITQLSQQNKMDSKNLGKIFGPILLRRKEQTPQDLFKTLPMMVEMASFILNHTPDLIEGWAELLSEGPDSAQALPKQRKRLFHFRNQKSDQISDRINQRPTSPINERLCEKGVADKKFGTTAVRSGAVIMANLKARDLEELQYDMKRRLSRSAPPKEWMSLPNEETLPNTQVIDDFPHVLSDLDLATSLFLSGVSPGSFEPSPCPCPNEIDSGDELDISSHDEKDCSSSPLTSPRDNTLLIFDKIEEKPPNRMLIPQLTKLKWEGQSRIQISSPRAMNSNTYNINLNSTWSARTSSSTTRTTLVQIASPRPLPIPSSNITSITSTSPEELFEVKLSTSPMNMSSRGLMVPSLDVGTDAKLLIEEDVLASARNREGVPPKKPVRNNLPPKSYHGNPPHQVPV